MSSHSMLGDFPLSTLEADLRNIIERESARSGCWAVLALGTLYLSPLPEAHTVRQGPHEVLGSDELDPE